MSAAAGPVPYARLKTILLDVGNTLVGVDFTIVQSALAELGFRCTASALERAEAAARPAVSAAVAGLTQKETREVFVLYLGEILRQAPLEPGPGRCSFRQLPAALADALHNEDKTRLWGRVLPGAREALADLRALGLQLVAVSNSDGTVEQVLVRSGLRDYLHWVVDSHRVGSEKPGRAIFEHALAVSGADPATTVHVGDMYDIDVQGALGAGLYALLVDPHGDWPAAACERLTGVGELAERISRARGAG